MRWFRSEHKENQLYKSQKNWFEQNSKKTLFVFFLIMFIITVFTTEKILSLKNKTYKSNIKRYIRLKEYEPHLSISIIPDEEYMKGTDSLIQKKYFLRIDEKGFIMPTKIHDNPDLTLVFLGGSTTECLYVDEVNRFPYLVGRLIEKETGLRVNSYNSGISGNNSLHSIDILLNKVIPLQPHIAVMMNNINDLTILLYEKTYWNKNPTRSPIVDIKTDPSIKNILRIVKDKTIPNLYREIHNVKNKIFKTEPDEFQHVRGKKIIFSKEYLLDEYKMNLQTFINICKARNIIPILMTEANRLKDKPDDLVKRHMKKIEKDFDIVY